jgi:hypothetical protein
METLRTAPLFKQYLRDQVRCMREDIGAERMSNERLANQKALEWIAANAARFREQWFRRHGLLPLGTGRPARAS